MSQVQLWSLMQQCNTSSCKSSTRYADSLVRHRYKDTCILRNRNLNQLQYATFIAKWLRAVACHVAKFQKLSQDARGTNSKSTRRSSAPFTVSAAHPDRHSTPLLPPRVAPPNPISKLRNLEQAGDEALDLAQNAADQAKNNGQQATQDARKQPNDIAQKGEDELEDALDQDVEDGEQVHDDGQEDEDQRAEELENGCCDKVNQQLQRIKTRSSTY